MADEHQFIENRLQRSQIDEFFAEEFSRAGCGGMDITKTSMSTRIVLKAEKPGMVIRKGGKNIRKVTRELEGRFNLDDPQIDVQEVDEPDLNTRIVADRLADALERGWYFHKVSHTTIDCIMDAGALGAEITPSGKIMGARSRVERFNRGYIKHNDEPAQEIVDEGQGAVVIELGTIGVTVKIIPPGTRLPDDFEVEKDANPDAVEQIEETESVEDLLEEEPEEVPDVFEDADVDAETDVVGEDVVEEAAVEAVEEEAVDDADDEEEAVEEVVDDNEELDEDAAEEAADLVAEMEDEDDDETEEE